MTELSVGARRDNSTCGSAPSAIEYIFKPMLIAKTPGDRETVAGDVLLYKGLRTKGSIIEAISGIDIALWISKEKP